MGGGARACFRQGRGLLLPFGAQAAEEASQQGGALVGSYAFDDLEPVVESCVFGESVERADGAGLGVEGAEDDAPDACVDERPCAHDAGLEGGEQGGVFEPPVAPEVCGLSQHEHLGVGGRVAVALAPVAGSGEDVPPFVEQDGAYGHVAAVAGFGRLLKRETHGVVPWGGEGVGSVRAFGGKTLGAAHEGILLDWRAQEDSNFRQLVP